MKYYKPKWRWSVLLVFAPIFGLTLIFAHVMERMFYLRS